MAGVSIRFKLIDQMSSRMEALADVGNDILERFNNLESAADRAFSQIEQGASSATNAVDQLATANEAQNSAIDGITDSASEYVSAEEEMSESSEEFGDRAASAMLKLEDIVLALGIVQGLNAIISKFKEASDVAAEFEKSMAVVGTIADTSALSMGDISSQIQALSKDSAQSVNSLAEATYGAISASVDTASAVEFVSQANELAVGGFTNQATAVDVLTTALNAYGMSAEETGRVADYLITTQNLGKTTVDQLASSMGMVIPTASSLGVEMDNLSTAYAVMTSSGVQTAQSTTYLKAMMSELANTGSEVSAILEEQTGESFSGLMEQGYSLGDVMQILGDSVQGDTTAFMNLWSSMEAGSGAVTLYNAGIEQYADRLDKMRDATGATAIAYEKMTNTTDYSNQRLENSFANLAIAFGSDLNPLVYKFNMGLADIVDGFSNLIEKHPAISAVLTGVAGGLSAVALGILGYNAVTKIAALWTGAWAAAIQAAIWPATLLFGAVAVITAAMVYHNNMMEDAIDEQYLYTDATMKQQEEINALQAEYERVVAVQGEASEEALRLRYRIDELTSSYESNKETIDEFVAGCEAAAEAQAKANKEYNDNLNAIHDSELGTLALVQKLDDLASSTEQTSGSQAQMEAIIGSLNNQIDGLNLSYEDLIENQDITLSTVRALAEEEAKSARIVEQQERYAEAVKNSITYEEDAAKAKDELTAAQERLNTAEEAFDKLLKDTGYAPASYASLQAKELATAKDNVQKLTEAYEMSQSTLEDNASIIDEIEQSWTDAGMAAEDAGDMQLSATDAVGSVLADTKDDIDELARAYDEAYASALESVQGQYSLWQEVGDVVAMTSEDISSALQSQIDYWNSYNANLDLLTEKASSIEGLTDVLASVADGSEDSAAMIQGMAQMSDEELSAMVDQYNNLQTSQSQTSDKMADLESGFSQSLDNMLSNMVSAVGNMNMSKDAADAARATMNAYINTIKSKTSEVNSAFNAVTFARGSIGNSLKGYATGTMDAEPGLALVGEEGPELINFKGGEVVYTSDETANILSSDAKSSEFYVPPSSSMSGGNGEVNKTLTLKIEGSGEIKVDRNGVNKEEVLDVLMSNIKGAVMNILQEEILEEGELSYEF